MRKQINKLLMLILVFVGIFSSTCLAKDIEVIMDGEKLLFDNPPILEEGRTLVPFRKIFEILDYEVSWNGKEKSILATKKGKELKLTINSKEIFVDEQLIESDVAPKLVNSTTYVPIRIISEYSDCDVLWDGKTKTVLIYSKQEPYKQSVQGSKSTITTDGKYIYYNDSIYDKVYKYTDSLEKEVFDIDFEDSLGIYKNKIYGLVKEEDNTLHIKSFNLKTRKETDISKEDVKSCVIYNGKIYYSYYPLNGDEKKNGIYVMNMNGKNKKQICNIPYDLGEFFVTDDYIFTNGKMFTIKTGKEQTLTDKYVTATAINEDNYYMAIGDYSNTKINSIGVCVYNYKTKETKVHYFNKKIGDIQVTDNSVFITHSRDYNENPLLYNQNESYYIVRMTKNFEYPVEIYKGVTDEDNNESFSGVEPEIDVIGNHIYINYGYGRILTNGEQYQDLIRILGYDVGAKNDDKKAYKYTIADFTEELGIKVVGKKEVKEINIKTISSDKLPYNYYAFVSFNLENSISTRLYIYPYTNGEGVGTKVNYEIINIDDIEVKNEKHEDKNYYYWDKGKHSYNLVSDNISEEDLYNIIDGISIEISDEDIVRECITIRGF